MAETKKPAGLLNRKTSNFDPKESYNHGERIPPAKQESRGKEKREFKNQKGSIKISNQSKQELEALMKLTNTKFHYEIIDLLVDRYIENELTPEQKRKFKVLLDL